MNRVSIGCRLCSGEGRVEEFTCPCCLGSGTFEKPICPQPPTQCGEGKLELPERPKHANLFNTTPEYAIRKSHRFEAKRQRNAVALGILRLSDFHLESDERQGA